MNKPMNQTDTQRTAIVWTEARRFDDKTQGVVVIVNRSNHPRPRYSYSIDFFGPDGTPKRHRIVRWSGKGKIAIDRLGPVLDRLLKDVETWIEDQIQLQEDEIVEKIESLHNARNGTTRHTGKTDEKRAKERAAKLSASRATRT